VARRRHHLASVAFNSSDGRDSPDSYARTAQLSANDSVFAETRAHVKPYRLQIG
jgi:hypothetical protein